ncbi:MAG: proton-conducting transporter membrane subunit [Spirochaetota bacterium]
MNTTIILLTPIALPFSAGIVAFLIPGRIKWVRESLAVIVTAAVCAAAVWIFTIKNFELRFPLLEIGSFYLNFDLKITPLSSFMILFVSLFGLLISLYSLAFMAGKSRLKEYYAFFLFALAGSCGVLAADHLLLFLIFWEVVTASLYFLITTGDPQAREGATKTFAMLGSADGCLLIGMGLLWYASKSLTFSAIHLPAAGWLPVIAFLLILLSALTKAGAMPLHTWIPAASQGAPPPVMALLPASIDKLLGIYLLVKITTGLFTMHTALGLLLMIIGAVTIIAAVMIAMVQHDLRRMLSYSAISQVGYMVLGIGTMTPIGIAGGIFHMLNNSIYKSCLFLCGGAVEHRTKTTDLGELGGLAHAMPVTFVTALISALAISGILPLNGFVSKWLIYQGVIDTGNGAYFIFLIAAMFGSALTLAYFIKAIYSIFLGQKSEKTAAVKKEISFIMWLPLIILAALSILFGVFYRFTLDTFILPGTGQKVAPAGIWNSTLATLLILIGVVLGLLFYLLGNVRKTGRTARTFIGGESVDPEIIRVPGTTFYDTIKSLPVLEKLFDAQEKGWFDPYVLFGKFGLGISGVLKKLHNGLLPWYLTWSLLGIIVLLCLRVFL